jgi:ABC-type Fe3+-hydroxamate transport system substrate-binding protein
VRTAISSGLVVLLAALAGCGGSGNSTDPTTATTARAQTVAQASPRRPLGEVRQRLVAAGYHPRSHEYGDAADGLDVGGVSVAAYATAAEAERDYREIKQTFATAGGRGVVEIVGAHVYFLAQERRLTAAERERFAKVVIAGEAIGP